MKKPNHYLKGRYTKPQIVSKRVRFMTSTFTAVMYGPQREGAPKRPPANRHARRSWPVPTSLGSCHRTRSCTPS